MTTFRVGDFVLWWGEMARVEAVSTASSGRVVVVFAVLPGRFWDFSNQGSIHALAEDVAAHQRPWRYDKALGGWVPDEGQERIAA